MADRKIRSLFIVPRFGSVHRGVEAATKELIARLDKTRFEVTVLSAPHSDRMEGVRFESVPVTHRERLDWLLRLPALLRRMFGRVALGSPAEVESYTLFRNARFLWNDRSFDLAIPCGGTWTYRLARRVARHVVSVGHSGPVGRDLRLSDCFVALTPVDEMQARSMRPGIPTAVIPNGVDVARFVPRRSLHSTGRGGKVILCVAALSEDKRHDLLFDAALPLPPDVRILCVGEGPMRSRLGRHALARAGRVEFRAVPYDQVHAVYHEADAFSLPSPGEAFGIAFLEALASGLQVVAHDGPRQRFVLGEAGLYCNVYESRGYAQVLAQALEMGPSVSGRERAEQRYAWERIAAAYESLFLELGGGCEETS